MTTKDICAFPDCGKELTHKEGRKKRKYCSPACGRKDWGRINYKPSGKPKKFKTIPIEQWEEIQKKLAATQTGKAINLDELKLSDTVDTKEKGDMLMAQLKHLGKASKKTKKVKATDDTEKSATLTPYQEMLKKKRGF